MNSPGAQIASIPSSDLGSQLGKLRDVLGRDYQLPEDILRRAGLAQTAGETQMTFDTQLATRDRIQAIQELIEIAQAEKVCPASPYYVDVMLISDYFSPLRRHNDPRLCKNPSTNFASYTWN